MTKEDKGVAIRWLDYLMVSVKMVVVVEGWKSNLVEEENRR